MAAIDCDLYEFDKVEKVIGHQYGFEWPVKAGETLKQFTDEYETFFNMGVSVSMW